MWTGVPGGQLSSHSVICYLWWKQYTARTNCHLGRKIFNRWNLLANIDTGVFAPIVHSPARRADISVRLQLSIYYSIIAKKAFFSVILLIVVDTVSNSDRTDELYDTDSSVQPSVCGHSLSAGSAFLVGESLIPVRTPDCSGLCAIYHIRNSEGPFSLFGFRILFLFICNVSMFSICCRMCLVSWIFLGVILTLSLILPILVFLRCCTTFILIYSCFKPCQCWFYTYNDSNDGECPHLVFCSSVQMFGTFRVSNMCR